METLEEEETRLCKRCDVVKPLDSFQLYDSGTSKGRRSVCRDCRTANNARLYRASTKQYQSARNRMLKCRYGITLEDYDRMFAEQEGKCAICGTTEPSRTGKRSAMLSGDPHPFHVDHCHQTGAVRGLLCPPCNKSLGLLGEHNLSAALAYVEAHKKDIDDLSLDY